MRILFLNPIARMGGAEQSLVDLLASLRDEAQVGLLTLEDGPLVAAVRELGVPATIFPLPTTLLRLGDSGESHPLIDLLLTPGRHPVELVRALRAFSAAIAAFKPDIVHSNGIKTHLLSGLVRTGSAKLVWHIRDFVGARKLVRTLLPRTSARVSATFAISAAVERDVRKVLPKVPVAVVYNAVDLDRFRPGTPREGLLDSLAGLPPAVQGTIRIGLVATYAIWKGHRLFLEAAALARRRLSVPLRFYVIGGPIYLGAGAQITEEDLRAWIQELDLRDHVGIVPFVKKPEEVYTELDVAVNANTSPEPFGRTVVEALASGVPVISAPDVGALEELPEAAVARLPDLSAERLAEGLAALAGDPVRLAELSRGGPPAAMRYSRQRLKERVMGLYQCLGVGGFHQ